MLLLAPALAQEAGPDSIKLKTGQVIKDVRVEKETLKEVVYRVQGSKQSFDFEQVAEIIYGGTPVPYQQGLSMMAQGNYEKAVERAQDVQPRFSLQPHAAGLAPHGTYHRTRGR